MTNGIIIKGISSFYYVKSSEGIFTCKARGLFRKLNITPVAGDRVELEPIGKGEARIVSVLERKNCLVRPCVANIDVLAIVLSASSPAPDWLLADRLLIASQRANITPILVLNKLDEAKSELKDQFYCDYRGFKIFSVSAESGEGMAELEDAIKDKLCCLCGQSAVGKTSIINRLIPWLNLQTGELSQKTERGRHTTRVAELLPFGNGAILDTPGFSLFDTDYLEQAELDACYPEFLNSQGCRFSGCRHIQEPDCGVKQLLLDGRLSEQRYKRYVIISNENELRRRHRYD